MPISSVVKTKRDGILTLGALSGGAFDLTTGALKAGAKSLDVAYEGGDFNLSIPGPAVNNFLDRGQFSDPPSVRYGDDQPLTWSFTAYLRDLSDAAYATLEEILMQSGYVGANWESTIGDAAGCAEVFAIGLRWKMLGTVHCDATDHIIILQYNSVTGSLAEGDPNTISLSGTDFEVYPTVI